MEKKEIFHVNKEGDNNDFFDVLEEGIDRKNKNAQQAITELGNEYDDKDNVIAWSPEEQEEFFLDLNDDNVERTNLSANEYLELFKKELTAEIAEKQFYIDGYNEIPAIRNNTSEESLGEAIDSILLAKETLLKQPEFLAYFGSSMNRLNFDATSFYAIAAKESCLSQDVGSGCGGFGIMQVSQYAYMELINVMPSLKPYIKNYTLDPVDNCILGVAINLYLQKKILERFDIQDSEDLFKLSCAAYNMGLYNFWKSCGRAKIKSWEDYARNATKNSKNPSSAYDPNYDIYYSKWSNKGTVLRYVESVSAIKARV